MPRHRPGTVAALIAAIGLSLSAPVHAKTKNCNVQRDSDKYGPSYITSLKVTNTTCKRGKEVVRAFHKCRHAHGGRDGRCPKRSRPAGYRCTEKRSKIATQLTGHVTCTKSTVKIVHDYTEFI
jgi:hypothetical protein